ncbi:MAG: Prokaryotic Cytochrome oxidase subunit, partial [Acidimicrobiaceae bacterium]|nr:Prokaryotic Cytochrome oxidase subunit [Acidimicrobiaceae bacterium]
ALILAGITAVEVGLSYWKVAYLTNLSLLLLAAVKFGMVAMFFMHLRFDNRVLRRFFVTGIVLAILVYVVVLLTFGVFSHQNHLTPGFNGQ